MAAVMTDVKFQPMLAVTLTDLSVLAYPQRASVKLDGVRCVVRGGVALSRNLKPIRNAFVQSVLGRKALEGLDGELIVGRAYGGEVLNRTQSGVMSADGRPDFAFHVFDDFSAHSHSFDYRLGRAEDRVEDFNHPRVKHVAHVRLHSSAGLKAFEKRALADGYEGVMVRDGAAEYKFGRATPREATLWKLKRFKDGEFLVTGLEEGEENNNPITLDELGYTKRSTHLVGKAKAARVGTVLCADAAGRPYRMSPGAMTAKERYEYWERPDLIVGRWVTGKWFEYGIKDEPRYLTFKALRDPIDLPSKV